MATSLLSLCSVSPPSPSHRKPKLPNPLPSPKFSSLPLVPSSAALPRKTCSASGKGSNTDEPVAAFLDEYGVVDDMDAYLNHLSLEYDSVWDTKPSWCQPWTITLTGVVVILCSWLILHSVVATAVVASLICTWWYIFLYSYPKQEQFLESVKYIFVLSSLKNSIIRSDSQMICLFQAYSAMIEERRRRVTSGVEDTYGVRKSQ